MIIIETEFTNEIDACEYNLWDEVDTKEHIDNCIKIANEHAIKFAEWCSKYSFLPTKGWYQGSFQIEMGIFKTTNELIEIFNKETDF